MDFESPLEKSTEGGPKEERWELIYQTVDGVKDKLGKGIDEGIKSFVAALKANGFGTTGSCEGHSDRGLCYPWVDVESPLAEKLLGDQHYNELKEKARAARSGTGEMTEAEKQEYSGSVNSQIEQNREENIKLEALLSEFYGSSEDRILQIKKGPWNQSRIQPADIPEGVSSAELQRMWPLEEKQRRLELYRQEISRFTEFLKKKFFKEIT